MTKKLINRIISYIESERGKKMKYTKNILSFLMVIVMALALAGCGKDKKSENKTNLNVEEAKITANDFAKAFTAYDTDKMKEYLHGEDAAEFLTDLEKDFSELGASFVSETNGAISKEKADAYADKIVKKIFSCVKMEVGEGKADGDKVEFSVKIEMPDFESIDMSELQNPDDEVMMKILGIDMNDPSGLKQIESLSSQQLMDRAIDGMINWVIEKIDDVDTIEEDGEITVEKVSGNWKITDITDID